MPGADPVRSAVPRAGDGSVHGPPAGAHRSPDRDASTCACSAAADHPPTRTVLFLLRGRAAAARCFVGACSSECLPHLFARTDVELLRSKRRLPAWHLSTHPCATTRSSPCGLL